MSFFESIVSYFEYIFDFISTSVTALIRVFFLLNNSLTMIAGVYGKLPFILVTCVTVVVSFSIIKFIVGRVG